MACVVSFQRGRCRTIPQRTKTKSINSEINTPKFIQEKADFIVSLKHFYIVVQTKALNK